jgi:hypothetical protein
MTPAAASTPGPPDYALLDLDNCLIQGNSIERWCRYLVHCGLGSSPPLAQHMGRLEDAHHAHREGEVGHIDLVTRVGDAYAMSMRGMGPFLFELAASHWEERSRVWEPRGHWMLDARRSQPLYWWVDDPTIPEPMWFADDLTAALAGAYVRSALISGGPTEPVSLFARRFHAEVGGALTLEENELECFTGKVAYNAGLPAEKARIAAEYAAKGRIRFAAGDSPNDAPLLERAEIKLIVGDAIDPPSSWRNVFRLPVTSTPDARRQLANLIRALGRPQVAM